MADTATSTPKRSLRFLLGMCALMLGANLVWVSYNSILLPTLVERVVTQGKGLVVGLIGFLGTVLAVLVNLLWGIISDQTSSRLGKRTPYLLVGALLAFPAIILPALLFSPALQGDLFRLALPIIITGYFGMQFFTNIGNGAWWPLLVDMVPDHQRGLASGIQGFFTLLGAAVGILVVTALNQHGHTVAALWLVGGLFAISGVVNALTIRGQDQPAVGHARTSLVQTMGGMFKVRRRVAVFFWLVLAVLLANMGLSSMQFFARYFFEVYFPAISPDAAYRIMGGISLLVTMLAAVGSGILSDRIGRRSLILWSLFACAITTLLMGLTGNFALFLVLAALRSIASGPLLATAPALASDLSPGDEAGHYMAYFNLATGLSGGLSSLIFGLLLVNLSRAAFTDLFLGSAALFLAGGLVFSARVSQRELDANLLVAMGESRGTA